MTENQPLVKLTLLVYRKEGLSEEEFHHHWTVIHPPIVEDWLKRYGIVRYVQYHTPSSFRNKAREQLRTMAPLVDDKMLEYDGFVELLMPSAKCFDDARKDPYYEKHVQPDEMSFADMSKAAIIVGYEEPKI